MVRLLYPFVLVGRMATTTQYDPKPVLDELLNAAGASKKIIAMVIPETEAAKAAVFGSVTSTGIDEQRARYLNKFRAEWTGNQPPILKNFRDQWLKWSSPIVDLDPAVFTKFYPSAGASEALSHVIANYGNLARHKNFKPTLHIFKGEYSGFKALAEASFIEIKEHNRNDWENVAKSLPDDSLFILSQPSSLDGEVWPHCNQFLKTISGTPRVVVDLTYVGTIPEAPAEKVDVSQPCVSNVVFSLSKPFGTYKDRIGGIFCREESLSQFGNRWHYSNNAALIGTELMQRNDVFAIPRKYRELQQAQTEIVGSKLALRLEPCAVYLMARGVATPKTPPGLSKYLHRAGAGPDDVRVCLTIGMARKIGMEEPLRAGIEHTPAANGRAP
jgi:hypothetical protein